MGHQQHVTASSVPAHNLEPTLRRLLSSTSLIQERIKIGREAQGFLTTDALAARTLVPPRELTYGEYDLDFFLSLVTECLSLRAGKTGNDDSSVGALEAEAR